MKIALVQMEIRERDTFRNIAHGLELMEEAAKNHDIVVLPEIWSTGYSLGRLYDEASEIGDGFIEKIADLARRYSCNIVAGSLPMRREEKIYNESIVFNRKGEIVSIYDKLHLFGLFNEEKFFAPGDRLEVYELDEFRCGSSICYDLRFPELYRHLALAGAELVFAVAEWPIPRGDIWRLLAQARAAENHMFLCAVNAVGIFKGEEFFGHSMLVAPSGKILVEGGSEECILSVEIRHDDITHTRQRINALTDVRKEFFPEAKDVFQLCKNGK